MIFAILQTTIYKHGYFGRLTDVSPVEGYAEKNEPKILATPRPNN